MRTCWIIGRHDRGMRQKVKSQHKRHICDAIQDETRSFLLSEGSWNPTSRVNISPAVHLFYFSFPSCCFPSSPFLFIALSFTQNKTLDSLRPAVKNTCSTHTISHLGCNPKISPPPLWLVKDNSKWQKTSFFVYGNVYWNADRVNTDNCF